MGREFTGKRPVHKDKGRPCRLLLGKHLQQEKQQVQRP